MARLTKTTCSNCSAKARIVRGDYKFTESGLPVVLKGIKLIRCSECNNDDPIIPHMNQLMRAIAVSVLLKPYRLRGEEIRFLRKYLRMSSEEFSGYLGIDKTHLSKWENNADPVGEQSDRLIRLFTLEFSHALRSEVKRRLIDIIADISTEVKRIEITLKTVKDGYAAAA